VTWGSVPITAAGGIYQLCWCSASGGSIPGRCENAEEHQVVAGSLQVVGPTPLQQDRTCISGRTCLIDGLLGEGLQQFGSVLLLETCGTPSVLPRVVGTGHAEPQANGSWTTVSWGALPLTAAGGLYRLCWCLDVANVSGTNTTAICQSPGNFRVDLGAMTLVGVAPLWQDRTCVSGQTCGIDGILGQSLSSGDAYTILDTCGTTEGRVPRVPT